jgi:hypothetical protein
MIFYISKALNLFKSILSFINQRPAEPVLLAHDKKLMIKCLSLTRLGIGFTNSVSISSQVTFRLHGTQSWGISAYYNYSSHAGLWKSYSIPIGQYYVGQFNYLFFANDDDQSPGDGESLFRNIRVINNN